ncbi:MAG: c-type cytochrome [Gallionella sp.]|nr:MAG: c-type cytochrome [Gallionella sp.]
MKYAVYIAMIAVGVLAGCGKTDDKTASGKEPATVAQKAAENQKAAEKPAQQEASAIPKLVPDVRAGNQLAKEVCASCHGIDGIYSESGSPFIAGLNGDYLAASLQGYTDGSRNIATLKAAADKLKVMKQLKPQQIADVSAYYASLGTPWKGAGVGIPPRKPELSLSKENIEAGADIAERCNSCHGESGNSVAHPDAASLAAMPPGYFIYSLKSYFNDRRKHMIMKVFGMENSISGKEIEQLAAYYAVQTPQKPPVSAKGNAKLGAAFANDCEGCHGPDGNSLNPALPNLTGQPVEYLALAMRDYRDGKRKDPAMKFALKGMSDDKIANIAAYYASQEPISLHRWRTQSSKEFRPVEEGKRIARMCDSCHGKNGNSTRPDIPNLSGLTARYLTEATIAYRDGVWKHDVMQEMVSFLKDDDIEKVSLYYALQEPVATKEPGKFDLAIGEKIKPACTLCHSDEGIKKDPRIPNLNGQDHQYLIDATMAYANGKRANEDMKLIAKAIKPQDVSNLINVAGYYTAQKANKPPTVMPQPAMKTIEKCHRCHGAKGESSTAGLPRLAGQSEAYLVGAMKAYQDMRRKSKDANEHAGLGLMEMKGIAAYYAKQ